MLTRLCLQYYIHTSIIIYTNIKNRISSTMSNIFLSFTLIFTCIISLKVYVGLYVELEKNLGLQKRMLSLWFPRIELSSSSWTTSTFIHSDIFPGLSLKYIVESQE